MGRLTLTEFCSEAIRVPFEPHGRSFAGWDCWGLVICAYREVLGIELPSYVEHYSPEDTDGTELLGGLVRAIIPEWVRVTDRRPLDVAVLNLRGRPVHVGLVLNRRQMLHVEKQTNTHVARIDGIMWGKSLEGVYRHAS